MRCVGDRRVVSRFLVLPCSACFVVAADEKYAVVGANTEDQSDKHVHRERRDAKDMVLHEERDDATRRRQDHEHTQQGNESSGHRVVGQQKHDDDDDDRHDCERGHAVSGRFVKVRAEWTRAAYVGAKAARFRDFRHNVADSRNRPTRGGFTRVAGWADGQRSGLSVGALLSGFGHRLAPQVQQ